MQFLDIHAVEGKCLCGDVALRKLEIESIARDKRVFSNATGVLWVLDDKHRSKEAAHGLST